MAASSISRCQTVPGTLARTRPVIDPDGANCGRHCGQGAPSRSQVVQGGGPRRSAPCRRTAHGKYVCQGLPTGSSQPAPAGTRTPGCRPGRRRTGCRGPPGTSTMSWATTRYASPPGGRSSTGPECRRRSRRDQPDRGDAAAWPRSSTRTRPPVHAPRRSGRRERHRVTVVDRPARRAGSSRWRPPARSRGAGRPGSPRLTTWRRRSSSHSRRCSGRARRRRRRCGRTGRTAAATLAGHSSWRGGAGACRSNTSSPTGSSDANHQVVVLGDRQPAQPDRAGADRRRGGTEPAARRSRLRRARASPIPGAKTPTRPRCQPTAPGPGLGLVDPVDVPDASTAAPRRSELGRPVARPARNRKASGRSVSPSSPVVADAAHGGWQRPPTSRAARAAGGTGCRCVHQHSSGTTGTGTRRAGWGGAAGRGPGRGRPPRRRPRGPGPAAAPAR